ncbi:MAG: TonB-dependent receptor plug domain-containing protein, partial [Roseimicrobium sp.]
MKLRTLCRVVPLLLGMPVLAQTTAAPTTTTEQTLAPVTVTADAESTSYNPPVSTVSGLKTETPLLETPQAISVVTNAVIKDQAARDLGDVIKNVAGVTPGGYYSEWDYYRIRGFDAAFTTYQDGLRGDYDGIGA